MLENSHLKEICENPFSKITYKQRENILELSILIKLLFYCCIFVCTFTIAFQLFACHRCLIVYKTSWFAKNKKISMNDIVSNNHLWYDVFIPKGPILGPYTDNKLCIKCLYLYYFLCHVIFQDFNTLLT